MSLVTFFLACSQCKELNVLKETDFDANELAQLRRNTYVYLCKACKRKLTSKERQHEQMEAILNKLNQMQQTLKHLVAHVKRIEEHVA